MTLHSYLKEEANGTLSFGGSRMALLDIEAGFWGLRRQMEALVGRQLTDNALQQAGANGGASFARSFREDNSDETAVAAFCDCVAGYQAAGFGEFEVEVVEWPLGRVRLRGNNLFEAWMLQQHGQQPRHPACAYTSGVLVGFINALTRRKDIVCIEHACQAQGDDYCVFELMTASAAEQTAVVAFDPDPGLAVPTGQPADADELSTLLAISQNVASTLPLKQLLGRILDQFKAIVAYDGAAVMALEADTLKVLAYRGPISQAEAFQWRFELAQAGANQAVLERQAPIIIADVQGDSPLAQAFKAMAGAKMRTTFAYVRSWMGVPLIIRNRVIGMLTLDHRQPDAYTGRHSLLALTFANKVAVAVENARLVQEEQARQRELQTLLDVTAAASSSLALNDMLQTTLDRLVEMVGASRAGVMLLREGSGHLTLQMLRPERSLPPEALAQLTEAGHGILATGQPLYVKSDADEGLLEPGAFVPLSSRGQVLGLLGIIGKEGGRFSEGQLALFNSIADQLAVAVENARLYEQAEAAAAAAERNRLARDLHDAVSQTLFSASLIADVLPRLWEANPDEGQRRLQELRELTRSALAEMRALLMELRPATLTEFSLAALLRQLAEASLGRSRLPVDLKVKGERPLPPEVKIMFYRIAQEALNNVSKHAAAEMVHMYLYQDQDLVELSIQDDGRGFALADIAPNSFGLGIMRERAAKVGAILQVESQIGEGTTITVRWQSEELKDE